MCKHNDVELVVLNHKGVYIDRCIVPYVKALNTNGITTAMSCCGHGEVEGSIITMFENQYRLVVIGPIEKGTPARFLNEFQKFHEKFDNIRLKEEGR